MLSHGEQKLALTIYIQFSMQARIINIMINFLNNPTSFFYTSTSVYVTGIMPPQAIS